MLVLIRTGTPVALIPLDCWNVFPAHRLPSASPCLPIALQIGLVIIIGRQSGDVLLPVIRNALPVNVSPLLP